MGKWQPLLGAQTKREVRDQRPRMLHGECHTWIPMGIMFIFIFLMNTLSPCLAAAGTLVLNTAITYPGSTPEGKGFLDLIVREEFRRTGLEVRIVRNFTERGLINVDRGIDDGVFGRVPGLEKLYPNIVMVPGKLCDFDFVAFTRNPSIRVSGWKSLKPYDVGIIMGWKILETNIVGTRSLTKVKDDEALFMLLDHGRVDLVVFERLQGNALVKNMKLKGIRAVDPPLATPPLHLYLNRRHAALVPRLAKALEDMKGDGTYQRFMNSVLDRMER